MQKITHIFPLSILRAIFKTLKRGVIGGVRTAQVSLQYARFSRQNRQRGFPLSWWDKRLFLFDATGKTGFDRHYVYHPAWAARVLAKTRPQKHVDISSILDFGAILSAFIPVEYYEYRPAQIELDNLASKQATLTALPFADDSVPSLSCMHVLEHVGLGRYGDPLDAEGDLKAIAELKRVVAPGGDLLVVVPVAGKSRTEFNAHRVYSRQDFLSYFLGDRFRLEEFTYIADRYADGGLLASPTDEFLAGQKFGCGCFWFKKL